MRRFSWVITVLLVVLGAMGFAAANAGNRVTLNLGLFTLYQVQVTLVAFSGLFVGMLVMFVTGIHSDLKIRRILRDRLAEEARQEQTWIDRSQQDLFAENTPVSSAGVGNPRAEESDPVVPLSAATTMEEPTPEDRTSAETTLEEPTLEARTSAETTLEEPTPEDRIIE